MGVLDSSERPEFLFLQHDYDDLIKSIDLARHRVREAKEMSAESVEQSSESWHDNYTFEEAQRQLKMHLNLLGGLSKALEGARIVDLPAAPDVVSIGTEVTFCDEASGDHETFRIGSYLSSEWSTENGFISYDTPIAKALLGAGEGDVVVARIGPSERTMQIIQIRSIDVLEDV
jgi:transcription elongation factor GreA